MKRFSWFIVVAVLLALTLVSTAGAQDRQVVKDLIMDNKDPFIRFDGTLGLQNKAGTNLLTIDSTGTITQSTSATGKTDGFVFVPAVRGCSGIVADGSITNTASNIFAASRIAANVTALAYTAPGAYTAYFNCYLDSWLQRKTTDQTKGVKITGLSIVYQILGAALTTHTWGKMASATYASGVAVAVSTEMSTGPTGTGFLNTAINTAGLYYIATAAPTAVYWPAYGMSELSIEWNAAMPVNSIYRLVGVGVTFTRLDN